MRFSWFGHKPEQKPEAPAEEEIITPTLVLLHGVNCTPHTWAYVVKQLRYVNSNKIVVPFTDTTLPFEEQMDKLYAELNHLGPIVIVGHSLGGLHAWHLAKKLDVIAGISISTPFGGSKAADWFRYIMPNWQLVKDVGTRSKPVLDAIQIEIDIPWTNIVTTVGNIPYIPQPNDCVISCESMKAVPGMEHTELAYNHYEVVLTSEVVNIIDRTYTKSVRNLNK